ncbi:MAG: GNVR domain-containing protein, partial [Bacteroidota bacterium]
MKNIPEELSSYSPQVVAGGQGFASGFEIDYTSYFQRLLRNWYWFILAAILGILAAWLYLRYTTAVYSAQASMLVEEHSGSGMGFSKEAISQELGFEKSYVVENELQVLKSRQLMERVVILLGIDVSYIHQGKVKDTELYRPEQFSLIPADTLFLTEGEPIRYGNVLVRLDNENSFSLIKGEADTLKMQYGENFFVGNRRFNLQRTGKGESLPQDPTYLIKTENPINIATKYSNKLNLKQMGRSGVIELSIKDPVPAKAKDILNRVIDVYSQQIIEEQSQTGQQTLNFLEERLAFVTKELYDVESSVAGFKTNTGMSVDLATRGADYLEQLNESDAQLAELQVRKELIENLRYNLIADSTRFRTLPVASEVTSGVLASLVQQYNLAVYERDAKLETVTAEHPTMATYTDKLKNFRRSILQSISTVLAETNQRAQRIKERIRPLEENMNQIPENQRKLVQIMRKVQIKENLFMFLLEKREEAALTVAAQVPNTRIIDRAMASTGPIAPNRSMIYLMALGLALFVPGSTLFLRELMGSKLESEKDVKKYSSAPIIGRIVKNRTKASMIMETKARTAIGESFRMLRANLNYVLARD